MAKSLRLGLAILVAIAAVVGLLLFVQSRDKSTFGGKTSDAPGTRLLPDQGSEHKRPAGNFRYVTDPPASGPHIFVPVLKEGTLTRDRLLSALEQGNVVLVYGSRDFEPQLRGIQEEVAGPFDPSLAKAGQAVILDYRPETGGVVALAWRRMIRTSAADDPKLQEFADAWLGKGAEQ